jgi:hypothetical protein
MNPQASYRRARVSLSALKIRRGAGAMTNLRDLVGRVLINAQIAAGYALTLRLRHGDVFLRRRSDGAARRMTVP